MELYEDVILHGDNALVLGDVGGPRITNPPWSANALYERPVDTRYDSAGMRHEISPFGDPPETSHNEFGESAPERALFVAHYWDEGENGRRRPNQTSFSWGAWGSAARKMIVNVASRGLAPLMPMRFCFGDPEDDNGVILELSPRVAAIAPSQGVASVGTNYDPGGHGALVLQTDAEPVSAPVGGLTLFVRNGQLHYVAPNGSVFRLVAEAV